MTTHAAPIGPSAGQVRLRYWASLRAAAGVAEDTVKVAGPVTLADLTNAARALHHSGRFAEVLGTCSVLVGDQPASTGDPAAVEVGPGSTVEFLPPFAGG